MTQEDKKLLFQDLCMRLPYDVIMTNIKSPETHYPLTCEDLHDAMFNDDWDDVPYLRHHSSMTKEEKKELKNLCDITPYETQGVSVNEYGIGVLLNDVCSVNYKVIDWFHAHHINYRLPDNLFIEAPKGMYNIKN